MTDHRCVVCGRPGTDEALCSPHCIQEAGAELRRLQTRLYQQRRLARWREDSPPWRRLTHPHRWAESAAAAETVASLEKRERQLRWALHVATPTQELQAVGPLGQ